MITLTEKETARHLREFGYALLNTVAQHGNIGEKEMKVASENYVRYCIQGQNIGVE